MKRLWEKIKAFFRDDSNEGDPQDLAFANAPAFSDDELQKALDTGELEVRDEKIKTPAEYEAEGWDAERTAPKTPAEAEAELRMGVDWA